jgi:hypothetical protein
MSGEPLFEFQTGDENGARAIAGRLEVRALDSPRQVPLAGIVRTPLLSAARQGYGLLRAIVNERCVRRARRGLRPPARTPLLIWQRATWRTHARRLRASSAAAMRNEARHIHRSGSRIASPRPSACANASDTASAARSGSLENAVSERHIFAR